MKRNAHARGRRRNPRAAARGAAGESRFAPPASARWLALRVLERVERAGAYADLALGAALARSELTGRDRAFATELVYGTLRWRGRIDYALQAIAKRPLREAAPGVRTLLRMGAYQLLFTNVPAAAAVDESVRCAHAGGTEQAAGFVNAVLREVVRRAPGLQPPALAEHPLEHLVHALSLPRWLAKRWLAEFGAAKTAALAAAQNAPPPITVRANLQRTTRAALQQELQAHFPEVRAGQLAPLALHLGHEGNPAQHPAFVEGRMTIQDEASQLAVEMLAPQTGDAALDLCAAPGAKATHIAERVGGEGRVLAADRNPRRLALVGRACRRLGLHNVQTLHCDATQPGGALEQHAPFGRILVDAPCSGLGALRRNPDARWRLRPEDPSALAAQQRALLSRAFALLRPGGALVYSTCTLLAEENEAVVQTLLADEPAARLAARADLPAAVRPQVEADGFMRTWPQRDGCDGFFMARITKAAPA